METLYHRLRTAIAPLYSAEESSAVARYLLAEVFGFSCAEVYTCKISEIPLSSVQLLDGIIDRLLQHEPVQYVLGYEYFRGKRFKVSPSVLIPRPETAELIAWILERWNNKKASVLDIGTGSGCIAISLASELSADSTVHAWDVSADALRVARENNASLGTDVRFSQVDILSPHIPEEQSWDIIVSNPPYITSAERADMEARVLTQEPHLALFVSSPDALLFYRRIAEIGTYQLKKGGMLYFEINRLFGQEIKEMLIKWGYRQVEIRKDAFGADRMVCGVWE